MEVTTSIREEDGKTAVTVELAPEEVQKHVKDFFKELAKTRIPGFRPGKAPRKILEQNFGGHDAVFSEIATDMINDVAPKAVDSVDVLFIADPDFEEADPIVEGEPFTFTLFGKVKPQVELLSYEPVEIKMPPEKATDAEIDAQVESLRSYYYSFETVDAPAEMGNYVMADITCNKEGGSPVEGLYNSNRLIELGQGIMPPEFDEKLVGAKAGDTKEFEFTVADQEEYGQFGEGTISAKVEVKEVRTKVVPELDDAFCEKIGVDSIEDLRKQMRDAINQQKKEKLPGLKENRCVTELARRIHGEVPQSYLNFTREDLLRDFMGQLQQQGTTLDKYLMTNNISADQFKEDVGQQSKEMAEQSLALDALFAALGLEIADEDIDAEFAVVDDPAAVRKQWEEAGRMSTLREAIRRQKATEWLVETAIVTIEDDEEDEDADEA